MFASGKSGSVPIVANYIEDVFSTYLYTGNGSTQTITNGIDLAGKGGLVWCKSRSATGNNGLTDTVRGTGNSSSTSGELYTDTTTAPGTTPGMRYSDVTSFNSTGFGLSYVTSTENSSGVTYVSWTFREQAKFFDVVTYTGNTSGGSSQTIAHNLGSTPGCIIVKATSISGENWAVWHRSFTTNQVIYLNLTDAVASLSAGNSFPTLPTETNFTVGFNGSQNGNGTQYVAYLFAHDAGGFGLTGSDNVISCGSFTTDGSGNFTPVTLGWEPQYLLVKRTNSTGDWVVVDSMRGFDYSNGADKVLSPNSSAAEAFGGYGVPTATGFAPDASGGSYSSSSTYIYIAIRRGPMKVPTVGTSVYNGIARTGTGSAASVTGVGFPLDMAMVGNRQFASAVPGQGFVFDRLRGPTQYLFTNDNAAEGVNGIANSLLQDGYTITTDVPSGAYNFNTWTYIDWFFRRAPSFFDEVCYTGTASYTTFTHNLTVAPQLVIIKSRANGNAWVVGSSLSPSASDYIRLSSTAAWTTGTFWDNSSFVATRPTTTTVTISPDAGVNASGITFVAYLFATCAGVSKVGSYTGTATTKQIDCGFTAGARFVLIKRTDSTGDWYVWDSARGIVAGNDPYLLLNSTAAEVTSTDYIDTYSAGFEISSTAPSAINASGGTFIFLAIA